MNILVIVVAVVLLAVRVFEMSLTPVHTNCEPLLHAIAMQRSGVGLVASYYYHLWCF